jgi:oligopeptide transport system substrate-binding protein
MPYNTGGQDGEMAVVVTQQLEELLGADFIKFVVEGYPNTDYLNTCRRSGNYSFQLCYWGPDYADPLTYTDPFRLGQAYAYLWRADGAATQVPEGTEGARRGRSGWDETYWINHDYTDMVEEANKEVVDMTKRYNALAECEAWLLEQAYVIPIGPIGGCGYTASYLNPFESQFAPFGVSGSRYKYQWVYEEPMSSEEYMTQLAEWQTERAARIAAAEAAGLDY